MKNYFTKFGITFDTRNTTLHLNGVRIRAFPAENVSAIRGLPNVSIIYADEISYFSTEPNFLIELNSVLERYAARVLLKLL